MNDRESNNVDKRKMKRYGTLNRKTWIYIKSNVCVCTKLDDVV